MRSGRRDRPGRVFAEPDPVRRLRGAAHWLRVLYSAWFDVVLIFEAATDESPETRALLRSKLAGRNEVMDAMIASLDGHLAVPVPQAPGDVPGAGRARRLPRARRGIRLVTRGLRALGGQHAAAQPDAPGHPAARH